MSCRYVENRRYGNCCGSSTISVPVYCVETVGCGGNAYIKSPSCGGYSGHNRWINGNCGQGYYERTSC